MTPVNTHRQREFSVCCAQTEVLWDLTGLCNLVHMMWTDVSIADLAGHTINMQLFHKSCGKQTTNINTDLSTSCH